MPSITCGHCAGTHSSVAAVRDCFSGESFNGAVRQDPVFPVEQEPKEFTRNRQWRKSEPEKEERRVYIEVPYSEKELAKPFGAKWDRDKKCWWMSKEDFDNAQNKEDFKKSWIIDEDSATETKPARQTYFQVTRDQVPEGRYAVLVEGTWKFYRVSYAKHGSNRCFLDVQASDDLHRVFSMETRETVLRAILADPKKAMLEYGMQIGRCGHCHRTLTDPTSISDGIGPICKDKMGW